MGPKYAKGLKILIAPISKPRASLRDCGLEPYAGQIGEVTDYYWINQNRGEVLYIYTVRVGADNKEIVLHEDEIEAYRDRVLKDTWSS